MIFEDEVVFAQRSQGGALINAPALRASHGANGSGVGVAVLDSGIDGTHPELASRIVAEGDFTGTTGSGLIDDTGHGTACGGIIAGTSGGMAPQASLWAIKVLKADGQGSTFDILAGLNAIYASRNDFGGLDIVNMSLGSRGPYNSDCDAQSPFNPIFNSLYNAGIAIFVSSGNNGDIAGIGHPACHSKAVAVGAVYDANIGPASFDNVPGQGGTCTDSTTAADQITCYSDSGNPLDILAPSHCATTPKPGGGNESCFGGTSAAAPYAAGVGAQILSIRPSTSPAQLRNAFMTTGKPLTDVNGITRSRIDAVQAYQALAGGGTPGPCTRDARTACLLNNRFEVRVTYNTGSQGGDAQVMSFNGARTESDQSVFFYFFDNVNFEMGVKMVNACTPPFNQYWAFVSGLTNVGYQVSIRDSVTGATKTYSNPLGTYPQTVGDTSALNCLVGGEPAGEPELLGILPAPEGADDEAGTEVASDLGLFDTARPAVELRASSGGRAVASGVASGAPLAWAGAGVSLHPEAPTEFGLDILGFSEWSIESGEIYIRADNVKNSRASTSGALGLALWASADPVTAEGLSGYSLGDCLGYPALAAGGTHPSLVCETAYQAPPSGCYHITILLLEQIDGLWYYVDWVTDGVTHPLNGGSCQPTGSCTPSATRACLLNDRFEVTVSYQTATAGGQASVMSFSGQRAESDQSVFLYFFDNANFEMGVKMVNACVPPFDRFWAFISGLTNQGYTVTIRDTATGAVKNYNNPLGTYPQTVGDTNAFLCQ